MTGADYRDRRPARPLPSSSHSHARPTAASGAPPHSPAPAPRAAYPADTVNSARPSYAQTSAQPAAYATAPWPGPATDAGHDMGFSPEAGYPLEAEAEVYYQFGAPSVTAPPATAGPSGARRAATAHTMPPQGPTTRAYAQAEAQTSHVSQYTATPRVYSRAGGAVAAQGHAPAQAPDDDAPFRSPFGSAPRLVGRGQKIVNAVGAVGSVALIVALGWWGWELAMRDIHGVPVIRALEGPMRIKPTEAGGSVVNHQGLAVNDVSARDGSLAGDDVRLAPAPTRLTDEDGAGLRDLPPLDTPAATRADMAPPLAGEALLEGLDTTLSEGASPAPLALSQEDAVAAALAEALGLDVAPSESASPEALAQADTLVRPPRPQPRPQALTGTQILQPSLAEVDGASLAIGTRLVQFGAFDSPELARAEWERISAQLGPLMSGKALVLQSAISGGQTFWRLRGHGFENEDDARRFCSAATSDGVNCIPVSHR